MTHKGSCHCGNIAYEVEGDFDEVMECNCSLCTKKGSLLWFVPRQKLRLTTPDSNLATYTFNKHVIKHHFCPKCGCGPFAYAVDPSSGAPMAAINVRCLEDVDVSKLKRKFFDGRSL
jgi:hypothetical protein